MRPISAFLETFLEDGVQADLASGATCQQDSPLPELSSSIPAERQPSEIVAKHNAASCTLNDTSIEHEGQATRVSSSA